MGGNQPFRLRLVVVCGPSLPEDFRERLAHLEVLVSSDLLTQDFPDFEFETRIVWLDKLEQAEQHLSAYFEESPRHAALLISDLLAEKKLPRERREKLLPTFAARGLQDLFQGRLYASIALVPEVQRVPELDHILRLDFATSELLDVLKLGCEKLGYIAQPPREPAKALFVIEDIGTEGEMLAFAKLRYRIYRAMGYMEEQLWDSPLQAELEWSDTTAIHVGAFMKLSNNRRQLVGGARVVFSRQIPSYSGVLARNVAELDPILREQMVRAFLPLHLPIFYSSTSPRLQELMIDVDEKKLNCGELSRVVVDKRFRGAGLAHLLVKYAIFRANESGIGPLLLECLPIHVAFYEKYGFRRISVDHNDDRPVIAVGKSMVPMELAPVTEQHFLTGSDVFVNYRRLCACRHTDCYSGFYALAGKNLCPLENR
jgi:GNAT superfamily N-acetyltransferase